MKRTAEPKERDLAGEATEREAYLRRLRADISPEEAAEECAEIEARAAWMEGADLDDGADLMGDPDEYDEHYCICSVEHGTEELDSNQCDCCGRAIA
ncbi:hypothetical protein J7E62_27395 [Variovorax paradoxus]|nr:hypothetical protein [Variovorax paradoxus]